MNILEGYFDYAAATPMLDDVVAAMTPYFSNNFYNPSALYVNARAVKQDIATARSAVAQAIGAKPVEVVFTAGGTEANNLAIQGIMRAHPGGTVLVSAIEHDSVLEPAKQYSATTIPVNNHGFVASDWLVNHISDNTVLISCVLVNNEIGTIQKIRDIVAVAELVRQQRRNAGNAMPLYVHTDACQALNYLDVMTGRLGVDLMTINSGKIYGPKQCGALYIKSGTVIAPLIFGGGQERSLRSGTENVASIVGFAKAVTLAKANRSAEEHRIRLLRDQTIELLAQIPGATLNGPRAAVRIANNINITFNAIDNERLIMEMDERGFMIASGSACSASSDQPSHVLHAIGLPDQQIRQTVRISLGRHSTADMCQSLVHNIKECLELLRA